MKRIIMLLLFSLSGACTSHLYVANSEFIDGDKKCMATAYWYKTDYFIGVKADRVLTVLSGGKRRSVEYVEENGRIIYKGDAARDVKVIGDPVASGTFLCGWVEGLAELEKFSGNELVLHMHCKAKTDPLSVAKGYIPAQQAPYTFTVKEEKRWSFTGERPEAPRPPGCVPLS